ncbi:MAG: hypothetical protein CSA52_01135 [Gammaproteobacteria bacterium]|nr:MAG: hypothetical protein CSB48_13045 [Pseudomonadota bacterium]PIE38785.1 MAG: hypothetical protein CSA52_01135 [Gammaproteobacteria bacterium]
MDYSVIVSLSIFAFLMVLSGFFSSSETAFFSLGRMELEKMRQDKNPRIGLIEKMLEQPRRIIITILIGNEFVNVAASVISASLVIQFMGAESKVVNLFIMVPILLLVGEITPKTLAIRHNVAFASFESRYIDLFSRLITPIRWLVRIVSDFFITLFVGSLRSEGNIITEDLVRTLAREAVGEGALDHHEAQFIDHIFDFGNKTLSDVMTPRSEIVYLPANLPFMKIVEEVRKSKKTRVPIYQGHRDKVIGILHARDLLGVNLSEYSSSKSAIKSCLRKPFFVPESKPVAELFHAFRERKLSIAIVVDEYGGVIGLVSMEDLLECIFGSIHSPSDDNKEFSIRKLSDNTYRLDASIDITRFNRYFKSAIAADDVDTLGGFLLNQFGELPSIGAEIDYHLWKFKVVELEENRITQVIVTTSHDQDIIKTEIPQVDNNTDTSGELKKAENTSSTGEG